MELRAPCPINNVASVRVLAPSTLPWGRGGVLAFIFSMFMFLDKRSCVNQTASFCRAGFRGALHFCRFVHYADYLPRTSTVVSTVVMAHATDASTDTGHRLDLLSLPHIPSPSQVSEACRAVLRHLAAPLAGVLSACKTSLALLMVQVYGLYHLFAAAEALR